MCVGQINGTYVTDGCQTYSLESGKHQITSAGESGGFRVTKVSFQKSVVDENKK